MNRFRATALASFMALGVGAFSPIGTASADGLLDGLMKKTQVVFDEQLAVPAHGSQMRGFTLPAAHDVRIEVKGIKHTDKGFSVFVIPQAEWDKVKSGKEFSQVEIFHGLKISAFSKTARLEAGDWALVVSNTENIINGMVASIKLTVDP